MWTEAIASPSTVPAGLGLTKRPERRALLPIVILIVAWAIFVPQGSQAMYAIALLAAATAAALLGWAQSWLAALFVIAVALLIGTEARGELGRGSALFGSLRILDVTLLAAGAGLVARAIAEHGLGQIRRRRVAALRAPSPAGWIVVATAAWAVAAWLAHGADVSPLLRTDVRLLLLALGMLIVARMVLPGHASQLAFGLLALTPALAVKSAVIYFSGAFAVGSFDRLQASAGYFPTHRVLLVGGDTLFILVPAIALAVAMRERSPAARWCCLVAGASAFVGLLLSGTRTGLLVAIALALATLVIARGRQLFAASPRLVALALLALFAIGAGAAGTGIAQRLTQRDNPHTGLSFRADEIRSASRLSTRDLVIGQGLGGSFMSKDVNGAPVRAAWSHVMPIWIVLKVGILGMVALFFALALFARRAIRGGRADPVGPALVGSLLFGGLVVMSLTINRLGQPEGALLAVAGVVLVCQSAGTQRVACA
ncbi:MAG: hypothetical protein H0W96_06020 [Solirubrobacterales bacterium]|nr:hypothetical protein [Solirubrobacterales bacterium]